MARFLAIAIVIIATGLNGCATAPKAKQVRPADIGPFLGQWEGAWRSDQGANGGMFATFEREGDAVKIQAKVTGGKIQGFTVVAKLVNGELIVKIPTAEMTIRLYDDGVIRTNYLTRHMPDRGTWEVKKKRQ